MNGVIVNPAVLSVKDVMKRINKKTIVEHISFEVQPGEVFGFLGPNGAGKTTTIRMLVGLIKPTAGEISIAGYDVQSNFCAAMRHVGCIVENPELYSFLSGWENLKQFSRMLGDVSEERLVQLVRMVNLEERIHDKVKTYSLGMKQRLGIAQALLGKPKILILDEPTNGLDPAGIRELREFIRTLVKEEGISVFISSHLLSEVQMICDRVAIINHGKMIKVATIQELIEEAAERVEWQVQPLETALDLLSQSNFVHDLREMDDERVQCRMPLEQIATLNRELVMDNVEVKSVRPITITLEDLFMELTGGEEDAGNGQLNLE